MLRSSRGSVRADPGPEPPLCRSWWSTQIVSAVRATSDGAGPTRLSSVHEGDRTVTNHRTGTREEWLAAREQLLVREKEHTRLGDELARQRRELPWVRLEKEYRLETDEGTRTLAELFDGR